MLSLEFLQFCSISKKRFMTCESQLWALRQFWGGRHSPHKSLTGLIHSWGRRINHRYMMSADNAGGERFLCVNPLCTVPPHSALWSQPPGPTRSENTREIFLNFSSLLSRGYAMGPKLLNAEETTGPRTMCRDAKIITTMAKPSFFCYKKHTFESNSVKKSQTQSATATRRGITFKERTRYYKQLKKNPWNFCEEQRISRFLQQLQTGIRPSVDLPACQLSYICSHHSRGAEHAQRSRVIAPPSQMCPKTSALPFYARSWRRCPDRK